MVGLKRFFQAEKGSSAGPADQGARAGSPTQAVNELQRPQSLKTSLRLGAEQHFQSIEEQFKELHDQMQSRPLSSRSHAPSSRASCRSTQRNPRHVDLLDALFSSHRYQMQTTNALSPISPFNEDVAERNMVRFLQGQQHTQKAYSSIVPALHQEDVADRNIARSRASNRPISRSASAQSQALSAHAFQPGAEVPRSRPGSSALSQHQGRENVTLVNGRPFTAEHSIRAHRSAPEVMVERPCASGEHSVSSPGRHLGVPPAHKQGNQWNNTPLPDSPTLPILINQTRGRVSPASAGGVQPTSPSTSQPTSAKLNSKRNIRGLSISTDLAARGEPAARIAHHAIQPPPTPSNYDMKQNPSIAEVMNSPLPAGTPTSISPLPPSTQKVAEIMDLFQQAHTSSTEAISPHTSFKSLQDVIVQEINSHEAFQRIHLPEAGPLFTPSPSRNSFNREVSAHPDLTKSFSMKESQFSRLIRRGSSKKHRRGSEHKSISTSVPLTVFHQGSEASTQRRHTDAPPPTFRFLNTKKVGTNAVINKAEDQVTYMDILLQSQKSLPNTSLKRTTEASHDAAQSQSAGTPASLTSSERSSIPSVYYMRAQTSGSSSNSRTSFSEDDSDEEVIELPSVGSPHVHIQAINGNNIAYMTRNTKPRNAYQLMNWPHGSRQNITTRGNSAMSENKSAQYANDDHQLRDTRSVESY